MKKLILSWDIHEEQQQTVSRYCHNCGTKTNFADSGKRRHNANGKLVYEFAIYKCPRDHTWNKPLSIQKSSLELVKPPARESGNEFKIDQTSASEALAEGYSAIEITIRDINDRSRLDKTVSSRISDYSRSLIVKRIDEGRIVVNGQIIRAGFSLSRGDIITILLSE